MTLFSQRELARAFAGLTAARTLRGDGPALTVLAVGHFKIRVANSEASAKFCRELLGGEIVAVRNRTLPDESLVDEFFLKIGEPSLLT